jgi:hypothetical protein
VFTAFLIPVLDLTFAQSPMLHPTLPAWARFLPGYGGSRILYDGLLTTAFTQGWPLLIALAWLAGLTLAVIAAFRHTMPAARQAAPQG